MGFRFRRTVSLFPGVRLNLNKDSTSLTLGPRGATVTMSKNGTHTTVGIPGSGLSYTTYERRAKRNSGGAGRLGWVVFVVGMGLVLLLR